jgi:hypothetical protein
MRIYYYGELIEDTNEPKTTKLSSSITMTPVHEVLESNAHYKNITKNQQSLFGNQRVYS